MLRRLQFSLWCVVVLLAAAPVLCAAPILSVNGNTVSAGELYQLDLNNDGTRDFEFSVTEDGNDASIRAIFQSEAPTQSFVPRFHLDRYAFVAIVAPGDTIDSSTFRIFASKKKSGGNIYSTNGGGPFGLSGSTGYIPLRLQSMDSRASYYGFAQLTRGSITIGEVGFESALDTPITIPSSSSSSATAPEPTSMALLASGAIGLLAYRRRRRVPVKA